MEIVNLNYQNIAETTDKIVCLGKTISYLKQLLDMYQDITNGYIRKKAFIRIAFKLASEDCAKAISEKMIQAEIYKIEKETADRISKGYKTFEDTPSL